MFASLLEMWAKYEEIFSHQSTFTAVAKIHNLIFSPLNIGFSIDFLSEYLMYENHSEYSLLNLHFYYDRYIKNWL